jgi:hypothetical protein
MISGTTDGKRVATGAVSEHFYLGHRNPIAVAFCGWVLVREPKGN